MKTSFKIKKYLMLYLLGIIVISFYFMKNSFLCQKKNNSYNNWCYNNKNIRYFMK